MEAPVTTESILERLAQVEPASRALEEGPAERRALTARVVEFADRVLDRLAERPVWSDGPGARDELLALGVGEQPTELDQLMDLIEREIDGPGLQPASGGHLGYIAGGGIYASALGDYLAAVTNRYAGVHFAGPGAVHVENLLLRWLCRVIGYPAESLGTLTSGGSIANLTAIVTARDAHGVRAADIERATIYATDQVHHCVHKAIAIAGLSEAQLRIVPMDAGYRMDPDALAQQISADRAAGLRPFLLVASAGTTDTGALDPLGALAEIAERERLWFHVDAAYGCGALLVRDPALLRASHASHAAYLQDLTEVVEEPSPADLSLELTRHFRGLRMWLPLQLHGLARHRAALEEKLLLCRLFYHRVQQLGFEVGPQPDLSVTMFRWVPPDGADAGEFNRRLLRAVLDDGRVFLSSTTLDGVFWIRLAVLCFRTHRDRIDAVLEVIARETGQA